VEQERFYKICKIGNAQGRIEKTKGTLTSFSKNKNDFIRTLICEKKHHKQECNKRRVSWYIVESMPNGDRKTNGRVFIRKGSRDGRESVDARGGPRNVAGVKEGRAIGGKKLKGTPGKLRGGWGNRQKSRRGYPPGGK